MLQDIIEENREIGRRFRLFREAMKKTPHEFEDETGFPRGYVLLFEKGEAGTFLRFIEHFYSRYHLNLTWLVRGKGEMIERNYQANFSSR